MLLILESTAFFPCTPSIHPPGAPFIPTSLPSSAYSDQHALVLSQRNSEWNEGCHTCACVSVNVEFLAHNSYHPAGRRHYSTCTRFQLSRGYLRSLGIVSAAYIVSIYACQLADSSFRRGKRPGTEYLSLFSKRQKFDKLHLHLHHAGTAPWSAAMPCHAMPCHAMPCHAMPCHAMPCLAMPCHAMPCHAMPCHAMPCHAMPCHAMPCHAMPCHAMPCHAMPCHDMIWYDMRWRVIFMLCEAIHVMPLHTMSCHVLLVRYSNRTNINRTWLRCHGYASWRHIFYFYLYLRPCSNQY